MVSKIAIAKRLRRNLVLRFWNNDVLRNTDGVVESILATLETPSAPHPHPLPKGEREPV